MRPRKPHAKSEIGRRPDSRIEVGVLGLTNIVNDLAAGKKVPRMRFSVLFIGISPPVSSAVGPKKWIPHGGKTGQTPGPLNPFLSGDPSGFQEPSRVITPQIS